MDLPIDEPFSCNPGVLEVRGEDNLVVLLDDFVDGNHDLIKTVITLFLKANEAVIETRLHIKTVSFLVFVSVHEVVFFVLIHFVLVKLNVVHIISQKNFSRMLNPQGILFAKKEGGKTMVDPKKIKIVFTDIDGTLYSHVTKRVPPSAVEAIQALQKKGIKVFLCSGRNYYLIRKSGVLNLVKPDGLVTMNGSNAIIENTIIYRHPIPSEVVDKMVMFAKRLKFGLTLIEENEGHINLIDERVIHAHEQYGTRFPQPRTYPDHYDRVVYQMIAFIDQFEEDLIAPQLTGCKTARWDKYAVDVMLEDSDKAKGIESVLEYLGLERENALSLGDGNNDAEMLRYTGISVAMGKAGDKAKKAADFVTDDIDEDGWANAFKKLGLI